MSFDINAAGGYGSGSLGDVTNPDGVINSYYLVEAFSGNTFAVKPPFARNGILKNLYNATDLVGEEFLLHAFATTNGAASPPQLGLWRVVKITSVNYDTEPAIFTTDKSLADLNIERYFWQAIWIPHFKSLTITSGDLCPFIPTVNDTVHSAGGVIAFKCSDTFTLNGGHINLSGFGHPLDTTTTFRPVTTQESSSTLDTALYAGCENSITKDKLLLNVGDGACWILAKNISTQSTSRIGNPSSSGVQYCRGSSDSKASHSGSNVGGSSILIATNTWTGFSPATISKYRSGATGRGLARAYIATYNLLGTILPDEGLYALDTVRNDKRLTNYCNIRNFGNGSDSVSMRATDTVPINSYAKVTAVSADYKTFTLSSFVTGQVAFATGKLVMIHQLQKSSGQDINSGKFILAKIVSISGSNYTVDTAFECDPSSYYVQMLTVPQVGTMSATGNFAATQAWSNGVGGIFAIACNGTLTLNGQINLEGKGTFNGVVNKLVGNHFMKHRLYIGQGNGTAFILANELNLSSSTRIGGRYDGATFGGKSVYRKTSISATPQFGSEGGYAGTDGTSLNDKYPERLGTAGWGGGAGTNQSEGNNGGWFSNAKYTDRNANPDGNAGKGVLPGGGWQGAHILIVADTINGFNLSAISTGGAGGKCYSSYNGVDEVRGKDGGAGYGGGGFPRNTGCTQPNYAFGGAGGYRGGGGSSHSPTSGVTYTGGGGAGAAFVYANTVNNQSTNGIIVA